jgi:hypothetical protein
VTVEAGWVVVTVEVGWVVVMESVSVTVVLWMLKDVRLQLAKDIFLTLGMWNNVRSN